MNEDTDGNGIDDGTEVYEYGTSPTNEDTDGDGYSDLEEINNGSDPLDPNEVPPETLSFKVTFPWITVTAVLSIPGLYKARTQNRRTTLTKK